MNNRIRFLFYLIISFYCSNSSLAQTDFGGTWLGTLKSNGYIWNMKLHVSDPVGTASKRVRISFPDWGMFRLATDNIRVSEKEIEFNVLWLNGHFKGTIEGGVMNVSWSEWGEAKGSMHRVSNKNDLFRREKVEFITDDGAILKGTIVFPNSEPPYNGMVLTHGSGPDTRTTGAYIAKAHLAVENGLAVLIYDKRGAGESTGASWANLSRLTKDALGMVNLLREDPSVKKENVGIGGSSQGAWIAPKAAYADSKIAFVFVVATPGISVAEQNIYSMETRIEAEDTKLFAKKALRTLYDFYRTNDQESRTRAIEMINTPSYDLKNNELFQNLTFSNGKIPEKADLVFWSKAMFEDPLVWWKEIKVPVASFSGQDDQNVPTTLSNKLIRAALEEADNTNFELHLFPNAGHGLTLNNLHKNDWKRMAHGYIPIMGQWFREMALKN